MEQNLNHWRWRHTKHVTPKNWARSATIVKIIDLLIRMLLSAIFIIAGIGKIEAYVPTQAYMETFAVPAWLLFPAIIFEITAGILLLIGLATRPVAICLAFFSLSTALIFHSDFSDSFQTIMFLKNCAIAGGLLLLAKHGSGSIALDTRKYIWS